MAVSSQDDSMPRMMAAICDTKFQDCKFSNNSRSGFQWNCANYFVYLLVTFYV